MPDARTTDQLRASEVHQAGFSSDFYYPLVPRVQNDAQIANEIAIDLKTEFFNSIDPLRQFAKTGFSIRSIAYRMTNEGIDKLTGDKA